MKKLLRITHFALLLTVFLCLLPLAFSPAPVYGGAIVVPDKSTDLSDLPATACTNQYLKGNGTSYACADAGGAETDPVYSAAPASGITTQQVTDLHASGSDNQDLSTLAPKDSPVFTTALTVPVAFTGVLRADAGIMSVDTMAAYPLLAGRATPQTFAFGNAASAATGYLTSTSHATKGKFFLNAAGTITVDELNTRFGVGTATPGTTLDINGVIRSNNYFWASGANGNAYFGVDGPTGYKSIYVETSSNPKIQIGNSVANGIKIVNSSLILNTGTATANTAPLQFTSGTVETTARAGVMEFTTDDLTFTITTGAARKGFVLTDGTNLTSGKIPVATTNGRLVDLTAQAVEADAKADYTAGDLDTEAEIITAINATNAKINALLAKLRTLKLIATP